MPFCLHLMVTITCCLSLQVNRLLARLCPSRKMSCIGFYRRNMLTFTETKLLIYWFCLNSFIAVLLQNSFKLEGLEISKIARFWVWNIKAVLFNEGIFIGLPFFLLDPIDTVFKKRNFYMRLPSTLDPRRPQQASLNITETDSSNHILSIPVNKKVHSNEVYNRTIYCRKHGLVQHNVKKSCS